MGNDPTPDPTPPATAPAPDGEPDRPRRARRSRVLAHKRLVSGAVAVALLAGGAGFALASNDDPEPAPGGGGGAGAAGAPDAEEAAFAFTECMRDQGIDDFPDPMVEADGSVFFEGMDGLTASHEQVDAARATCQHFLDEARPDPGGEGPETATREIAPAQAGWEEVVPGGECRCADGSDYRFHARAADPEKVVLYLDGGGACWSAETCDPDGRNEYRRFVDGPTGEGVFDFANQRNPFAGHSFVFAPYCTGDLHIGTTSAEYTPELTVHHEGYTNGTAALDYLATTFPEASEVVVIGASAGSVTAPLYGGLVSDRLPDARVTVIADSSGSYPDTPEFNDILPSTTWGAGRALPDWPAAGDPAVEAAPGDYWSAAGFFIRSGQHAPDITFARYDHAYDENQARHIELAGVSPGDLLTLIDANEARIEAAGVNLHSFTAPGDEHVILAEDGFYTDEVEGVGVRDWVTALVAGDGPADVHCSRCRPG